jgi:hypothetical protein
MPGVRDRIALERMLRRSRLIVEGAECRERRLAQGYTAIIRRYGMIGPNCERLIVKIIARS